MLYTLYLQNSDYGTNMYMFTCDRIYVVSPCRLCYMAYTYISSFFLSKQSQSPANQRCFLGISCPTCTSTARSLFCLLLEDFNWDEQ